MVEPGRSIVGRAGVTVYRVTGTKDIPGVRRYVAVDGGMSDLLRPMLYGAVYEAILPERPEAEASEHVRLVGKHCESGDIVVHEIHLPSDIAPGDVLAVAATGAYGRSMASNYNQALIPAVVGVGEAGAHVMIRRQTIDDLLSWDVSE